MILSRFKLKSWLFMLLCLVILGTPLYATITNEGNQTVEIEIQRTDKPPRKIALFPGQSTMLPSGATRISVAGGKRYGDEIIKLKVIDKKGVVKYIEKADKPLDLTGETGEEIVKKRPKAENTGNLEVTLTVLKSDGRFEKFRVRPEHSVLLPNDSVQVTLSSNSLIRGDEIIDVKLTLSNGETQSISALDATVTLNAGS